MPECDPIQPADTPTVEFRRWNYAVGETLAESAAQGRKDPNVRLWLATNPNLTPTVKHIIRTSGHTVTPDRFNAVLRALPLLTKTRTFDTTPQPAPYMTGIGEALAARHTNPTTFDTTIRRLARLDVDLLSTYFLPNILQWATRKNHTTFNLPEILAILEHWDDYRHDIVYMVVTEAQRFNRKENE